MPAATRRLTTLAVLGLIPLVALALSVYVSSQ